MSSVQSNLKSDCRELASAAKSASRKLTGLTGGQVDAWLRKSAEQLIHLEDRIIKANQLDLARSDEFGLSEAQVDRLRLGSDRIHGIAQGLRDIAALPSPVGEIFESTLRPNGLLVNKVRVPLGVVFFIYESRPNVTADAAAICVKSRNAVILRGGKEAAHSSRAIIDVLSEAGREFGIPQNAVQLVDTTDRSAIDHFLSFDDLIDLAIPRGGEALIRRVVDNATMPVIKHFSGNCHVYVDEHADLENAVAIVENSKCHRLGVCNAAESLLVHEAIAPAFLPMAEEMFRRNGIEVRGDHQICQLVNSAVPATEADFRSEFLDAIISANVVPSLDAAIDHINEFGSGHTDAIVSENARAISKFTTEVDSAAVMVNSSTRFNDGGEFGLGAEIGISTDRFHARGPCGLKELTTYKYVCVGDGQIR